MPEKYTAIKDEMLGRGASEKIAKKRAAMIYNSQRKPGQKPVTSKKDAKK